MKKSLGALFVLVAANCASQAAFTYDGFNYTVGGTLAGNTDWTLLNAGAAPVIASGDLTINGLPSTGNKVSFASGNIQEALGTLNTFNSGTVYFSLAFRLTAVPTTTSYSFALSTGNTNYGAPVFIQVDGTDGFELGVANRSNSTPVFDTTKLFLNTTYFIVGSYTFVSGATNDTSALWINPDPSSFGALTAPTSTLTAAGGNDLAAITQFLLRGQSGSPSGEMDELRVGTSWDAVTTIPEPSTFLGLIGGTALLGMIRRRSR